MLRQRTYIKEFRNPNDRDGEGPAYEEMSSELDVFWKLISDSKRGHLSRDMVPTMHRADKSIRSALRDATSADVEKFLPDVDSALEDVEKQLDRINKEEKRKPELKQDQRWMKTASALEEALGILEKLLNYLEKASKSLTYG
jgi:spore cortex formation protein SpoVR/YcgB (stage V sporulation)